MSDLLTLALLLAAFAAAAGFVRVCAALTSGGAAGAADGERP
jgi:hypothetical protein